MIKQTVQKGIERLGMGQRTQRSRVPRENSQLSHSKNKNMRSISRSKSKVLKNPKFGEEMLLDLKKKKERKEKTKRRFFQEKGVSSKILQGIEDYKMKRRASRGVNTKGSTT